MTQVLWILYQHRDLVELLAAELTRRGTLRGPALSRLLRRVKPLAELYQVKRAGEYEGAVRS
jgi:DNA-binding transcriptional ArsR family regulator